MWRRVESFFVFCSIFTLMVIVIYLLSPHSPNARAHEIEYKDFISILLTGLAVMVAVATVLLAAAAIWAFEFIRREACAAAILEAKKVAEKEARETASAVAIRMARSITPAETSPEEAQELATALSGEEPPL